MAVWEHANREDETGKVYVWDEIQGRSREIVDNQEYPNPIGDGNIIGGFAEGSIDRQMGGWEMQYVADFPGGIRVVIESDGRAHTAMWLTICP